MTTKQFIYDTLIPYFEDPSTCGYADNRCLYLTQSGQKCAVGKHMKPGEWQYSGNAIIDLVEDLKLKEILTEKAFEIIPNPKIWQTMQKIHDNMAIMHIQTTSSCIRTLETQVGKLPKLHKACKNWENNIKAKTS